MTFRDAVALFRAKAAAGEIVNRKTGKTGPFAASRIGPIVTNVTAALRYATQQIDGRQLTDAELQQVEMDPLWAVLPHYAYEGAKAPGNERSDPGKERSNVSTFVSAVTGRDIERAPQPVVQERVPDAWRPLYDAILAAAAAGTLKEGTARGYRRGVLRLAQLALANGVTRPEDLPDEAEQIYAWAERMRWKRKDAEVPLSAYRKAVELAGATHLPRAYGAIRTDGLGIKSLPDYPERLTAAGYTGDPRTITALEAVKLLAPPLGIALEKVILAGRTRGMSWGWADTREDMASWIVATLLRHADEIPVDLKSLKWPDLWLRVRPVQVQEDKEQSAQLAEYLDGEEVAAPGTEMRSLMRLILDASAARSWANSHLTLASPAYELDAVPVYTDKLQGQVESAWMVTLEYFGPILQAKKPTLWAQARSEYDRLLKHIADYNQPRKVKGRKKKSMLPISWPQMVCMGLPFLARNAHELRTRMTERLYRVGNLDSRDSQQLVSAYCDALRDWMVVLLLMDDGLRIKNYAGAMSSEQIIPIWERTARGEIVGLKSLSTKWSGLDHEDVALKVDERGQVENVRTREITPALLDRTLAFDYWTLARPRALVHAGLIGAVEEYNSADDTWATFVTPRPRAHQVADYLAQRAEYEMSLVAAAEGSKVCPVPPTWRGNFSEDMLSNIFGHAMHRVCVEVLGRELPDFDSSELTKDWRGIFSAHISRTQVACYFGGIRGEWTLAMWLTNDTEATLRKHYVSLQQEFDKHKNARGWENPRWFDEVVDRALGKHPGDDWRTFWATFNPERPWECLAKLTSPEGTRKMRARRGRAAGV